MSLMSIGILGGWLGSVLVGVGFAIHAIFRTRTAQGAFGWAILLMSLPWVSVPFYLVFGRRYLEGYELELERRRMAVREEVQNKIEEMRSHQLESQSSRLSAAPRVEPLEDANFTRGNRVTLLQNGEQTFSSIIESIAQAKHYVALEYYVLEDGDVADMLLEALRSCRQREVRVFLLLDYMGSKALSKSYLRALQDAGVEVAHFGASRRRKAFQLNFRNHRKIAVIDAKVAFTGGLNLADEYLHGLSEDEVWRDTHVKVEGPTALDVQLIFAEDWVWQTGSFPDVLRWGWQDCLGASGNEECLSVATGPYTPPPSGAEWFLYALSQTRRRLWIATPYVVLEEPLKTALRLASRRGADVRVIFPETSDVPAMTRVAKSYVHEMWNTRIRFFSYKPGFMHQKVLLADDFAAVGTINLDARSMFLNFENVCAVKSKRFVGEVERMLLRDMEDSDELESDPVSDASRFERILIRTTRIMAPLL